jgi:RNA polymerase sigma-70 factor, ECF subfamily
MQIGAILARGDLSDYHLAHVARADLYRRLGRTVNARASYRQTLALMRQEPERRFLEKRRSELDQKNFWTAVDFKTHQTTTR